MQRFEALLFLVRVGNLAEARPAGTIAIFSARKGFVLCKQHKAASIGPSKMVSLIQELYTLKKTLIK